MRTQKAYHQEKASNYPAQQVAFGLSLEEGAESAKWAGNTGGKAFLEEGTAHAKASVLVQYHLPVRGICEG